MEFFLRQTHVDFIRLRRKAYVFSLATMVLSLCLLVFKGLNFGIDFTGGVLVEIGFPQPVQTEAIARQLLADGIQGTSIQHFGHDTDVLVRIPPDVAFDKDKLDQKVLASLKNAGQDSAEIRRLEYVGPQVGDELVEDGGLAMLFALTGIGIYIWIRFEQRFAAAALAATVHDPILTLGFFSLTGLQFDLSVLAALLAVIGYSVNDTIVIFDRIRENLRKMRKTDPKDVVNASINQTMSRTLMTSGTTLLVVLSLLLFGGPLLRGFSVALIIGILVGTYSSIYVASAVALDLGVNRSDVLPPETAAKDTPAAL